jgi:hypothetical protein
MDHYFTREFDNSDISGDTQQGKYKKGLSIAKFFTRSEQDIGKSKQLGRYVSRKIDMIRIIIPGDKHNIVERRMQERDKEKYAKEWEAYVKMEEFVPEGTLLETWPMVSRAQVEDLKYNNIFTVEQLSELSDENLGKVGLGGRLLREHAKAFIETSRKGAVPAALVAENKALKDQVHLLSAQMDALSKQMELLARKAGEETSSIPSPAAQVKEAMALATGAVAGVYIPADYAEKNFPYLRKLCSEFTDAKVLSKEQAISLIEEYQAKTKVLKSA